MLGFFKNKFYILKQRLTRNSRISYSSLFLNKNKIRLGSNFTMGKSSLLYPIEFYKHQKFDPSIKIGNDVYVGSYTQLHAVGAMSIGNGVVISDHVYISDVAHGLMPDQGLIMDQPLNSKGVITIGDNCFIGYGASVLPGVELGQSCVVAARAVVTRPFPDYSMLAGNPAKLVKVYDPLRGAWLPVPAA